MQIYAVLNKLAYSSAFQNIILFERAKNLLLDKLEEDFWRVENS